MAEIIPFERKRIASADDLLGSWNVYAALNRAIAFEPSLAKDEEVKALLEAKFARFMKHFETLGRRGQ